MKRTSEKGEQILTAAYNIFGEKGFYAAKMEDIAHEAGVAKGTLYLYYANKEELFLAVIEKILQDYLHTYEQILNGNTSFPDKLTSLVRHHLFFMRDRHDFAKTNIQGGYFTEQLCQMLSDCAQKASTQFATVLRQAYPSEFSEQEAYLSYLCLNGMGDGMIGDLLWDSRVLTDEVIEERARFAANLFVNGLSRIQSSQ